MSERTSIDDHQITNAATAERAAPRNRDRQRRTRSERHTSTRAESVPRRAPSKQERRKPEQVPGHRRGVVSARLRDPGGACDLLRGEAMRPEIVRPDIRSEACFAEQVLHERVRR